MNRKTLFLVLGLLALAAVTTGGVVSIIRPWKLVKNAENVTTSINPINFVNLINQKLDRFVPHNNFYCPGICVASIYTSSHWCPSRSAKLC